MFWRLFFMKVGVWLLFFVVLLSPLAFLADFAYYNAKAGDDSFMITDSGFEFNDDELLINLTGFFHPRDHFGISEVTFLATVYGEVGDEVPIDCSLAGDDGKSALKFSFPAGKNTSFEIRQVCKMTMNETELLDNILH